MATERISMKINQVDKEALRRLAELEGEAMSVLIRRILREELAHRGLMDRKPTMVDLICNASHGENRKKGDRHGNGSVE